ncbi:mitochondrial import inner membrane translocase subunit Tim17-like [Hibiscus syriacus]|uniref:Mitochondrial import inner membrane translocase subunit Tim17-like n=1 Tax=Hibiscus syriacus TaxID=106335 RepID=A0A6A2WM89_HIBSY|nr:mitochondrial import inner membrane translocase subunit Tim17-like [Hibiscus syriacus]
MIRDLRNGPDGRRGRKDEINEEKEVMAEEDEVVNDPRWDKIKGRFRGMVDTKFGSEKPEFLRWNKQDNWGRKTRKEATESTLPKMVGEGVYGVGPILAALCAGRRESYALYVQEGLDLSSLVLDASPLEMVKIKELDPLVDEEKGSLWVALDEVTDPQNLGAIISEGTGLRPLVERSCTQLVRIPGNIPTDIVGEVDDTETTEVNSSYSGKEFRSFLAVESLNVSVAAGVLLHHLTGSSHGIDSPIDDNPTDTHR